MNVLFGLMLSLVAASEASPPAWWIEGEAWFAQQGSQGPDQAPVCLAGRVSRLRLGRPRWALGHVSFLP